MSDAFAYKNIVTSFLLEKRGESGSLPDIDTDYDSDPEQFSKDADEIGGSRWVAAGGGDPYNPKKPEVKVAHHDEKKLVNKILGVTPDDLSYKPSAMLQAAVASANAKHASKPQPEADSHSKPKLSAAEIIANAQAGLGKVKTTKPKISPYKPIHEARKPKVTNTEPKPEGPQSPPPHQPATREPTGKVGPRSAGRSPNRSQGRKAPGTPAAGDKKVTTVPSDVSFDPAGMATKGVKAGEAIDQAMNDQARLQRGFPLPSRPPKAKQNKQKADIPIDQAMADEARRKKASTGVEQITAPETKEASSVTASSTAPTPKDAAPAAQTQAKVHGKGPATPEKDPVVPTKEASQAAASNPASPAAGPSPEATPAAGSKAPAADDKDIPTYVAPSRASKAKKAKAFAKDTIASVNAETKDASAQYSAKEKDALAKGGAEAKAQNQLNQQEKTAQREQAKQARAAEHKKRTTINKWTRIGRKGTQKGKQYITDPLQRVLAAALGPNPKPFQMGAAPKI